MQKEYDVIVIGSGPGGLACASILAQQRGLRVLVLERHFKFGGYTHTFERKGRYEWDVGVHYVGEMRRGMRPRAVLDYVTQGAVEWIPLPEVYDTLVFPGMTFGYQAGEANLLRRLCEAFPDERASIETYAGDIRAAQGWYRKFLLATLDPTGVQVQRVLAEPEATRVLCTTGDYLRDRFRDPRLQAVVAGQWGDYGVPPDESAFLAHSNVVSHYRFGGWYPKGGSARIAESMVPIIERHGGRVLVNQDVQQILLEGGRAVGVRVEGHSRELRGRMDLRAEFVISNAGAYNTYLGLLPADCRLPFREELRAFPGSMSCVTVFAGLRGDPRELGFKGENQWLFSSYDHTRTHRRRDDLLEGQAHFCYLSFPSLKNPLAKAHTAELTAPIGVDPFAPWKDAKWKRRGADYEALKARMSDGLIDFVETTYPGFRAMVDFVEVATPLTAQHFSSHPGGAIYGLAGTPERYRSAFCRVHTPVPNLLLTGSDAAGHGVVGAAMGGVLAASVVLGPGTNFLALLSEIDHYSASL